MTQAMLNSIKAWWINKAVPWLRTQTDGVMTAWWADLGDHPKLHFITFLATLALYFASKLVVALA